MSLNRLLGHHVHTGWHGVNTSLEVFFWNVTPFSHQSSNSRWFDGSGVSRLFTQSHIFSMGLHLAVGKAMEMGNFGLMLLKPLGETTHALWTGASHPERHPSKLPRNFQSSFGCFHHSMKQKTGYVKTYHCAQSKGTPNVCTTVKSAW